MHSIVSRCAIAGFAVFVNCASAACSGNVGNETAAVGHTGRSGNVVDGSDASGIIVCTTKLNEPAVGHATR